MKKICDHCKQEFDRETIHDAYREKNSHRYQHSFCSRKCFGEFYKGKPSKINKQVQIPCAWCAKPSLKSQAEIKKSKSGHMFCNRSCAVSFNNTQKRKSRRSKAEKLLFELLSTEFPTLSMIANDKTMLNGLEADIAIPDLSLCIEWNGIVHYQPIYGTEKLAKIQNIDEKKQTIAKENGVNLIIVPDLVSTTKYVKEAAHKIASIIRSCLARNRT